MEGSYWVLWEEVYSDTRRKPKKAVSVAAQSNTLSWYSLDELNKVWRIVLNRVGVIGSLLGRECVDPWDLLMPRISR